MSTGIINIVPLKGSFFRRPSSTSNGFDGDLDTSVQQMLSEMNDLLTAKAFSPDDSSLMHKDPGMKIPSQDAKSKDNGGTNSSNTSFLHLPLKTKDTLKKGAAQWPDKSLLNELYEAYHTPKAHHITLSDLIDKTQPLSALKYDVAERISEGWTTLPFNTKVVLNYTSISDYLIAYGYFVRGIKDVNGMYNFINSHTEGVKNILKYTVISAARKRINDDRIDIDHNDDNDLIIQDILKANLSLTKPSFQKGLDKVIDNYINNGKWIELINKSNIGPIPADMIPELIKRLKAYPVTPTAANINYILPTIISQMSASTFDSTDTSDGEEEIDTEDATFDANFFIDDSATSMISRSSIEYAAQLYASMVLGEELDIFNLANFFTHKYMLKSSLQIQDRRLRENLQMYVFNNKFTDVSSGIVYDRTRPAERQMFYKQVFNYGNAAVMDDMVVNEEFPSLWKALIVQAVRYIQDVQDSPNPDTYVSRQPIMQSVEDLQYNLSTHCTGMANVISPIIHKELKFIREKIFSHPEVLKQLVPAGGSWWKVVELLYTELKRSKPETRRLSNKAKFSNAILMSVAAYDPGSFEDNSAFSTFMSNIDALILTQRTTAQDAEEANPEDRNNVEEPGNSGNYNGSYNGNYNGNSYQPTASGSNGNGNEEWDF